MVHGNTSTLALTVGGLLGNGLRGDVRWHGADDRRISTRARSHMRRTVAQPERVLDGGGACALLAEAVKEVLAEVVEGELLYLLQLLFFHVDRVLRGSNLKKNTHTPR